MDHFPLAVTEEFVRLDKLIYDRKDLPQIKAIANWIDTHCAEGEISYMIPHDMLYCPDHFKNCQLPATPINDKLAFGFSVPGTHNFPMQFFEAKYVLTADPFPQTFVGNGEMSHKLNERFLAVRDEYFALEATFDMGNGTTFTIWRRTVLPPARGGVLPERFKEEDAQYPEMFSQIAEAGWPPAGCNAAFVKRSVRLWNKLQTPCPLPLWGSTRGLPSPAGCARYRISRRGGYRQSGAGPRAFVPLTRPPPAGCGSRWISRLSRGCAIPDSRMEAVTVVLGTGQLDARRRRSRVRPLRGRDFPVRFHLPRRVPGAGAFRQDRAV